jgi:hypothetical protein
MAPHLRRMGVASVAVAAMRHRLEEKLWSTSGGARWLLRQDLYALCRHRDSRAPLALAAFEFSRFSQNGEDGIIEYLTRLMKVGAGVFVEIGAGDGAENCTRQLAEAGWRGVWIEGDAKLAAAARALSLDGRVVVVHSRVDPDNIVGLLRRAGTPIEPDVMSIDIDSGNYQVTERALRGFSPRLLVVEVNGEHRWDWVQTQRTNEGWDRSWNFGASLGAYSRLAGSHGYSLVGCDSLGVNAFFVRTDMVQPDMVVGDWHDHYVPPSHRPGTVGHPRRSVESPTMDHPVSERDLLLVHFKDVEVIGSPTRHRGDLINVLVTIVNRSSKVLAAVGDRPIHLAGRVFDLDGHEIGGQEPRRSLLAKVIPPGGRGPASIEVRLPEHVGQVLVVPTMVQENVAWRPCVMAQGVKVAIA